jgi:hypothetical protein
LQRIVEINPFLRIGLRGMRYGIMFKLSNGRQETFC